MQCKVGGRGDCEISFHSLDEIIEYTVRARSVLIAHRFHVIVVSIGFSSFAQSHTPFCVAQYSNSLPFRLSNICVIIKQNILARAVLDRVPQIDLFVSQSLYHFGNGD